MERKFLICTRTAGNIFLRCIILAGMLICCMNNSLQAQSAPSEKMLEHAFKRESQEELKKFFYTWQTSVTPASKEEIQKLGDTLKNVYSVFLDCYLPQTPKDFFIFDPVVRVGFMNALNPDSVIIRNARRATYDSSKLAALVHKTNGAYDENVVEDYFYIDEFPEDQSMALVRNIKPQLSPESYKKALYMDEQVLGELTGFINYRAKNPSAKDLEDMEKRANFINQLLEVSSNTGLSGCAIRVGNKFYPCEYYFDFYPKLTRIIFEKTFRFAAVTFTYHNSSKELLFEKIGGKWVFTKLPVLRNYRF